MLDFNDHEIRACLLGKPAEFVTAFSAACAHRLVNSAEATSAGDELVHIAKRGMRHVEDWLLSKSGIPDDVEQEIDAAIPDEDDEPSFAAATVDDALAAVLFSIRSISTDPVENACDAAARAHDTALRAASASLNAPFFTDETMRLIQEAEVVQRELERQQRDLTLIAGWTAAGDQLVCELLNRARSEAVLP